MIARRGEMMMLVVVRGARWGNRMVVDWTLLVVLVKMAVFHALRKASLGCFAGFVMVSKRARLALVFISPRRKCAYLSL